MFTSRHLPTGVRQALGGLLLVVILLLSIWFVPLSEPTAVRSVDSLNIGEFPSGLAIYVKSGEQASYYSLSPWNDYVVDKFGTKHLLASGEIPLSLNPNLTDLNRIKRIGIAVTDYISLRKLSFHTSQPLETRYYIDQLTDNALTINRQVTAEKLGQYTKTALTLTFNGDDVVYSPQSNKLLSAATLDQVRNFYNKYQLWLNAQELTQEQLMQTPISWEVPSGEVVLFSPSLNKRLLITAQPSQRLFVNQTARTIELHQDISADVLVVDSKLQIAVLDE